MRAIAERASSPEDLAALWSSERFREAHERVVANVSEDDVRSYLEELSDEDLDRVSGGVSVPSPLNLSPRGVYFTALSNALSKSLVSIPVPHP
jgi:hypothetical protein